MEEGLKEDLQPLYIDEAMECIACSWCASFKGSIEARVVNQHVTHSKSHTSERKKRLFPNEYIDPMKGVKDIRTYLLKK